jgi:hypothetical protein
MIFLKLSFWLLGEKDDSDIDLRIEPHPFKEQDFNSQNPFAYEIARTGILISLEK